MAIQPVLVRFGRYSGMLSNVMLRDEPYCKWLWQQSWFQTQPKHARLKAYLFSASPQSWGFRPKPDLSWMKEPWPELGPDEDE